MPTAQIYIKVGSDEQSWLLFKQWCEREGLSYSEKIMDWIRDHAAVHQSGNNQTMIEFAGNSKTQPLYKTCRYGSNRLKANSEFMCQQDHISRTQKICELRNRNGRCYREMKK